jgi:hypothetical protein
MKIALAIVAVMTAFAPSSMAYVNTGSKDKVGMACELRNKAKAGLSDSAKDNENSKSSKEANIGS